MANKSSKPLHAVLACLIGAAVPCASSSAMAQQAAYMSCGDLWYARNAIYAAKGYCFQTAQARATFGAGCFPPYGALSGSEKARVNELQMWERRKGC